MRIQTLDCIGCSACLPYCPVGAIELIENKAYINYEECLECGTCGRSFIVNCPKNAIKLTEGLNERPRSIRKFFSDPTSYHIETRTPGRGTEEVKTNDVSGKVKRNEVGIGIEVGRPCLGTDFKNIERITTSLSAMGVRFQKNNPLFHLMKDSTKGIFIDDVKNAKVISAIIEFTIPIDYLEIILPYIIKFSNEIDTVFSLGIISRFDANGDIIVQPILDKLGFSYRPNAKINMGLGKPLIEE